MANKTQLRVETVGDGSNARKDFQQTEQAVGQLQSKLVGLASQATGLDLSKIGGLAGQLGGILGPAGQSLSGLLSGAGDAGVAAGLTAATAATGGLVAGLGALAVVGKNSTDEVVKLAGEVRTFARTTGMGVEDASALLAVFKRFGVDGPEASAEMVKFSRALVGVTDASEEAATGGKSASAVLADLGVQVRDAAGNVRPLNDLLLEVADGFKAMPDGVQKTADAVALFGRSGAQLLPILNQGSAGIKQLEETARQYGLVLTGDNIAAVKEYGLAHKDLNEAFEGLRLQVGVLLMPVLVDFAKWGAQTAQDINKTIIPALRDEGGAFATLKQMIDDANTSLNDFDRDAQRAANKVGESFLKALHAAVTAPALGTTVDPNDPLEQWFQAQFARYQHSADVIEAFGRDTGKKTADATDQGFDPNANGQADKLKGYGSAALAAYLSGMTSGGIGIFDDLKRTLEEGLKAASPDGKIDLGVERDLLPALAQLADEIDRTGQVSAATWDKVAAGLGGESPLVQGLIADYTALAAAKQQAAQAGQALADSEATLKEDRDAAAGEAASYADQIKTAQANQAAADKAEEANIKGLEKAHKALGDEARKAASDGAAALIPLNDQLKAAEAGATAAAAAYKAQDDELQRQIDLNNQVVSGLEHERDVKLLAIDERLYALRGSKDAADRREAAQLRRERAQEEKRSKPAIDLAREEANVRNYGLQQQQQAIQEAAKAEADKNAATIAGIQAAITKQQELNTATANGYQKRLDDQQAEIDKITEAHQTRHDDDQDRITQLQAIADKSAAYWAGRLTSDQAAVDAARQQADYYKAQETASANTLANDQKRIAALAAAGLLTTATPAYLQPTTGGDHATQYDNNDVPPPPGPGGAPGGAQGGGRDARITTADVSGAPNGARVFPPDYAGPGPNPMLYLGTDGKLHEYAPGATGGYQPPQGGTGDTPPASHLGAGLVTGAQAAGNVYHLNLYGVGEAALLDRIRQTIEGIAAT